MDLRWDIWILGLFETKYYGLQKIEQPASCWHLKSVTECKPILLLEKASANELRFPRIYVWEFLRKGLISITV